MEWMRRRSLVVALQPPMDVLLERLKQGQEHRPLIHDKHGKDLQRTVERMMLTRAACYGSAHVFWRQSLETAEAIDEALAGINGAWKGRPSGGLRTFDVHGGTIRVTQVHGNVFVQLCAQRQTTEICPNRERPVFAVDQDGGVHFAWTALEQVLHPVDECAARIEDIVNQEDDASFELSGIDVTGKWMVERGILVHGHAALNHIDGGEFTQPAGQRFTHGQPLPVDTNQHQRVFRVVDFQHFTCHAVQLADHRFMGHHQVSECAHASKFG